MLHVISFLGTRDCAGLQAVSRQMRMHVHQAQRLNRYSILQTVLDEYHPLLKTGEMRDEVLDENDEDYEDSVRWKEARKSHEQEAKAYAKLHMDEEMYWIVYEL